MNPITNAATATTPAGTRLAIDSRPGLGTTVAVHAPDPVSLAGVKSQLCQQPSIELVDRHAAPTTAPPARSTEVSR